MEGKLTQEDKAGFVTVVAGAIYALAGLTIAAVAAIPGVSNLKIPEGSEAQADAAITGAEALWARLEARGYVERA